MPHAKNEATAGTGDGQEVPDYGIYADKDWPNPDKNHPDIVDQAGHHLEEAHVRSTNWVPPVPRPKKTPKARSDPGGRPGEAIDRDLRNPAGYRLAKW